MSSDFHFLSGPLDLRVEGGSITIERDFSGSDADFYVTIEGQLCL